MLNNNLSEAAEHSKELAYHSYNYYRLKIFEQTAFFSSAALQLIAMFGLGMIGIVFFAIAGGLYLNSLLDNSYQGFLIIGLLLFVLAFVVYGLRKRIENFVVRKLSKTFFEH